MCLCFTCCVSCLSCLLGTIGLVGFDSWFYGSCSWLIGFDVWFIYVLIFVFSFLL